MTGFGISHFPCVQDPIVFSGSIRSNLDPFGRAESDAAIWQALYQAGLAATIKKLKVWITLGAGNRLVELTSANRSGFIQLSCVGARHAS